MWLPCINVKQGEMDLTGILVQCIVFSVVDKTLIVMESGIPPLYNIMALCQ